jgi:hypothetical protein
VEKSGFPGLPGHKDFVNDNLINVLEALREYRQGFSFYLPFGSPGWAGNAFGIRLSILGRMIGMGAVCLACGTRQGIWSMGMMYTVPRLVLWDGVALVSQDFKLWSLGWLVSVFTTCNAPSCARALPAGNNIMIKRKRFIR